MTALEDSKESMKECAGRWKEYTFAVSKAKTDTKKSAEKVNHDRYVTLMRRRAEAAKEEAELKENDLI